MCIMEGYKDTCTPITAVSVKVLRLKCTQVRVDAYAARGYGTRLSSQVPIPPPPPALRRTHAARESTQRSHGKSTRTLRIQRDATHMPAHKRRTCLALGPRALCLTGLADTEDEEAVTHIHAHAGAPCASLER